MNPTTIRIARRIVTQMMALAEQQSELAIFMGYGLCLAVCFEEMTGKSAMYIKPQALMQWAKDLPDEKYPRVQ